MIGNINLSLKSSLIIILVAGLLLGTIFTFGVSYWYATVSREECIVVNATYKSFEDHHIRMTHEIELFFFDYEQKTINDDSFDTEYIVNFLNKTPSNSKVVMLLHPNSEFMLELIINGDKLFSFETTMKQVSNERIVFVIFGCLLYAGAFAAGIKLITMRKKK